jgi:hypothetical protein
MASFPALEPFRRSYSFPAFQVEQEPTWPGFATRYKTGDPATTTGLKLTLQYEDIREAELQQIREHWRSQMGGVIGFNLPVLVWSKIGNLSNGGIRFRYANAPEEVHKGGDWYEVTIELESFAFESAIIDSPPPGEVIVRGLGGTPLIVTSYLVTLPSPTRIVTRGVAPQLTTQGGGAPVGRVVIRGPDPILGVMPGGLVVAPVSRVVIRGQAPTWTQDVAFRMLPAGSAVTRGVVPTINTAGIGQIPPPGRVVTRGVAPTLNTDGAAVLLAVARVVTRAPVPLIINTQVEVDPPAGGVVTRAPVPTVSVIAGGVVLLAVAPVVTRAPAATFSNAGAPQFPPAGWSVARGVVPAVTGA